MEGYGSDEQFLAILGAQLHGPISQQSGVEVWEVGGDGKAFNRNDFDVTASYFFVIICMDGGRLLDTADD